MGSDTRKTGGLVGDSVVYGLGAAITAAVAFLLIPLYTSVLPKAEYGRLQLINTTAEVLALVMLAGARQAFIRFYFDDTDEAWHRKLMGTTAVLVVITSIGIGLLFMPFRNLLATVLLDDPRLTFLFNLVLLWIPFEIVFGLGLALLQVRRRPGLFISLSVVKFTLVIVSNIALVYYYRRGIEGVLFTNACVAVVFGTAVLVYFLVKSRLLVSISLAKKLLRFGLPFLPTAFALFVIVSCPQYVLKSSAGLGSVGIFALAAKISMVGTILVVEPFGKVWTPFIFQNFRRPDGPQVIGRGFTLFCRVSIGVALAVSIAAPIVIPFLAGKVEYHEAATSGLIPILCVGLLFYGLASASDVGILIEKKTYLKPRLVIPAVVASAISNVVLVPILHEYGAALATLIAYFLLFLMTLIVSRRYYRFTLELREILGSLFVAGFVYGLFEALYHVLPPGSKMWAIGVFLLYLAVEAPRWRRHGALRPPLDEVKKPGSTQDVPMQPALRDDERHWT